MEIINDNIILIITSTVIGLLSIALILLKIILTNEMRNIQRENAKKYKDLIDKNTSEFRSLVERMDNKVTSFSNFVISNSVSHISPTMASNGGGQAYNSYTDYDVNHKSNSSLFSFRQSAPVLRIGTLILVSPPLGFLP